MKVHKHDVRFVAILVVVLFLLGVFMINLQEGNNVPQEDVSSENLPDGLAQDLEGTPKDETKQEDNSTEVESPKDAKIYSGDIHFQVGIGEQDDLSIILNDDEVFSSDTNKEKGVFQFQLFDKAMAGKNSLKFSYDDKDDGQPIVLFIIKDGEETILNWEPKEPSGKEILELDIR